MKTIFGWDFLRAALCVVVAAVIAWAMILSPSECRAGRERQVLLLNSYSFDQKWTRSITEAVSDVLGEAPDVRLVVEFMDTKRHNSPDYYEHLFHLYKRKFAGTEFDVVITSDDNGTNFALKHRDALFPGVPIVFCGVNDLGLPNREEFVNITGALEKPGLADTLELIHALHPELKTLYVVNEAATVSGKKDREFLEENLNHFKNKFEPVWLEHMSEHEMKRILSGQDEDSAVLLLSFFPDKKSGTFTIEDGARFVSSASPRPVYSMWEYFLGEGIVGGMLTSGTWQGRAAAEMALQILDGASPESIPVRAEAANRFMFDHELLERFGISHDLLPADSTIINRPDSLLRRYRLQLAGSVAVILLLVLACIALSVNIRERRRAEKKLEGANKRLERLVMKRTQERDQLQRAEAEVRRSEARYRSIFESSPLSLWEEDMSGLKPMFEEMKAQGVTDFRAHFGAHPEALEACLRVVRVVNVNNAAVEMHGALDKTHLLDNLSKCFSERSWPVFADELTALAEGERSFFCEAEIKKFSGERLDVLFYLEVVDGYEDSLGKVLATFVDVTEKKKFEEAMIQTEKMVSVGGLAAGMAHEINNPLGIVMQAAQGAARRVAPNMPKNIKQAAESGIDLIHLQDYLEKRGILGYLEGIQEAGARASAIVRNMLDFSRKSESRRAPLRIDHVLDRAVEFASSDYNLKKKYDIRKVEFIKEFEADLPKVPATETEIEQVFLNLIKNSTQAMFEAGMHEDGRQRIILRAFRENSDLRVEVEDNGPGMGEMVKKRAFEPFFTTKQPGEGTGLGLSVSYFIITRNHGGTFMVESSPGRGAKFIISLPLNDPRA